MNTPLCPRLYKSPALRAFTLIEVMVSTALVILIMSLLISSVDATQKVWSRGRARVTQFQSARAAFEAMTRHLSQATLNTYYDVEFRISQNQGLNNTDPINFFRQSELHFVSGKAAQTKLLGGTETVFPTHSVFFQAPVGYTSPYTRALNQANVTGKSTNRDGHGLLSALGYYIKWGKDEDRPGFIIDQPGRPEMNRFRLWQVQQPSEGLGLFYNLTEQAAAGQSPQGPVFKKATDWIKLALDPNLDKRFATTPPRIFAENIVALVIIPKLAEKDRPSPQVLDLAPDYEYDSRPADASGKPLTKNQITALGTNSPVRKQYNQLPPIVQVTMVAIDEASAAKLEAQYGTTPPPLTDALFKSIKNEADFQGDLGNAFEVSSGAGKDSLVRRMLRGIDQAAPIKLNYRIYTTDVVIRGSKWSSDS